MIKIKMMLVLLFLMALFPVPLISQMTSIRPDEALKIIFNSSEEISSEKKTLSGPQKTSIEKKLGAPLQKDTWTFYLARTKKKIDGYAMIDHEIGKTEPITFLTAILPSGDIKDVEILVFREPYGGEIKDKRFLKQYQHKSVNDPIRTGQDIRNITGATLSARAVSRGVKRDLTIWQSIYGK